MARDPIEVLDERAAPPTRTTSYGDDPAQVYDVRLPERVTRRLTVVVVHGGFWRPEYDRTHAGRSDFSPIFPAVHRAKLPLHNRELKLKILVDSSSVEVFSADGQVSISDLVYPDPTSTGVATFADGGTAQLKRFTAQTLGKAIKG